MLFAAKHRKDRNFKLCEDEVTSCILGPLSYMSVNDVWAMFRAWLPFKEEMWPTDMPTDVQFSFWPNLKGEGRIEPDLLVRFSRNGDPALLVLFEIKWDSPISGKDELAKQWDALSDKDKQITFHVYLVKNTGRGRQELDKSLSIYKDKSWHKRSVCIGWRSLMEVLLYNDPRSGTAMDLWADGVLAFLQRRGQSIFTGFDWLSNEINYPHSNNKHPRISLSTSPIVYGMTIPSAGSIFWKS